MMAGWVTVTGRSSSLPWQFRGFIRSLPFLQPHSPSRSNVPPLLISRSHFSCRPRTFVYLSLIPLVTQSLSPDRSLGLGLWLCFSHQMLIGYRGWVWEPENELLTDNSPLCTLHQKKEIEGEREAKWETGRIMRSLFNSHIYTKNIVAPLRKSLFGAMDDWHDIKLLFSFLGTV